MSTQVEEEEKTQGPEYQDMSQFGISFEDSLSDTKIKLCIEGEREVLRKNYFNLKNL